MWQWFAYNSPAIQAIAAVVTTVSAVTGFFVLCTYAWDTRTIAKATVEQSRSILLPFLTLHVNQKDKQPKWVIRNVGSGPALNITYKPISAIEIVGQKSPMMMGESRDLCDATGEDRARFGQALRSDTGFEIHYESLSGERLRSGFKQSNVDGAIQVSFVRTL